MITVLGLGLTAGQLTRGAMEILASGQPIILRTRKCEAAAWLDREGIPYRSLDARYEAAADFDQLNEWITDDVLEAERIGPVIYGVLDLRDESVARLAERAALTFVPGVPVDGALTGTNAPTVTLSAVDAPTFQPEAAMRVLVREVFSREVAAELKLKLMERFPEDHEMQLLLPDGRVQTMPLYELDRLSHYDHRMAVALAAETHLDRLTRYGFDELNRIVRILRGPDGCPWDRAQTHMTLRTNAIEEAWEVVDAIERGDMGALEEELGDLLLQVSLNAEIARQHGAFSIDDVTSGISRKLIDRHTHIFGGDQAATPEAVLDLWEINKRREKHLNGRADEMHAVTRGLPALMRAEKVLKKAGEATGLGDAARVQDALAALDGAADAERAVGELLLEVVALSRARGVHAELALKRATESLIDRVAAEDGE